jgi:hypothetical protein
MPEGRALALFYSALHHVEAVAAASGKHLRTHRQREDFLKNEHPKMWKFYRVLWQASEQARYLADGGFTMNSSAVEDYLRKKHHTALELWASSQLGVDVQVKSSVNPAVRAPLPGS